MPTTYTGIILDLLNTTKTWLDSDPKKDHVLIWYIFELWYQFLDTVYSTEIIVNGGSSFLDDRTFTLKDGVILEVADYTNELKLDGSLYTGSKIDVTTNNSLKEIHCRLKSGNSITNTDHITMKWLWDIALGRYRDVGFYRLEYDYTSYYKPATRNVFRTTYIGGVLVSSGNSSYSSPPSNAYKYCGDSVGNEVAKAIDNSLSTEWMHAGDSPHTIILGLPSKKQVGGVDIYYTANVGNTWTISVSVSDTSVGGQFWSGVANTTGCTNIVLIDNDARFITLGVQYGDFVLSTTSGTMCMVTSVISETQLVTTMMWSGDYNNDAYSIMRFSNVASGISVSGSAQWARIPFTLQDNIQYLRIDISSTDGAAPIPDTKLYDCGEIQVETFSHESLYSKGLNFEIKWDNRIAYTSSSLEFLTIRNLKVHRYEELGSAQGAAHYVPNIDSYDSVWIDATIPYYPSDTADFPNGIDAGIQLALSDDGINWSSYFGTDGTDATYFKRQDRYIDALGGYTGYYFKWKFFLFSDGRDTPTLDGFWIFAWVYPVQRELTETCQTEFLYETAYPAISTPMDLKTATRDSVFLDFPGGLILTPVELFLFGELDSVHIDLFSGWEHWSKNWWIVSSWLESVVGQVIHGYVRDQDEAIILNGFKVVITSSYAFGLDNMGSCDPNTGWYELFVKSTIYDNRWLMAHLNTGKTFDLAYRKYGTPALLDGTTQLASPQDLYFWKPDQICGKSVAFVGSLVTY